MSPQYSQAIVALSYVIAVIASYVALDMASRVAASRGTKVARYWLIGGAIAMGAGIWSMHFVGMLAFTLPIPVPYSIPITALSLVFAIAASAVALITISRGTLTTRRLLMAGVIMGSGVALMHYTGMAALQVEPGPTYHWGLFALSIFIAIAASVAAMWICFQLKSDTIATAFWKKSASALVMGVAIWGMHFTAMAAAIFDPNTVCGATAQTIDNRWLATTVGLCTVIFLAATMLISLVDAKMSEHRTNLEAQSERFFNQSLNLICLCGPDGRLLRVNPAGIELLGISQEAFVTLGFRNLIHPDDSIAVDVSLRSLGHEKHALSFEARSRCADGSVKTLLWNISHSDADAGFYATGHDITERKRADEELAKTHRQLLEVSRKAGMAEVATGVLHNVGNVLNSVNISATVIGDTIRQSRADYLEKICAMLEQNKANLGQFITADPQGRHIPEFLGMVSTSFADTRRTALAELENLRKSIEHIKNIITTQQTHAKSAGVTETLPVAELVESALRITHEGMVNHHIELVRDLQVSRNVTLDKHKVMQVLINLIRNAKNACNESGHAVKRITVRVTGDDRAFRIAIIDTGVGIPAENLTRIFNHGFTTRKDGHGFGLHTGALAARELGGSLTVASEGRGLGATFTLELPYEPHKAATEVAAAA